MKTKNLFLLGFLLVSFLHCPLSYAQFNARYIRLPTTSVSIIKPTSSYDSPNEGYGAAEQTAYLIGGTYSFPFAKKILVGAELSYSTPFQTGSITLKAGDIELYSFSLSSPIVDRAGKVTITAGSILNNDSNLPNVTGGSIYLNPSAGRGTGRNGAVVLKSMPLLGTQTSGGIEYDGTHFYGTDNTNTRRQLDNDTGENWQTATLLSGNTGTAKYRKIGNIVYVYVSITYAGSVFITLPIGYRPLENTFIDTAANGNGYYFIRANSDGNVILIGNNPSTGSSFVINSYFFTD